MTLLARKGSKRTLWRAGRVSPVWLLLLVWLSIIAAGAQTVPLARRVFGDASSRTHLPRVRSYDLEHVALNITLDERRKSVSGTSTLTLRPLNRGLESVEVDSAELHILSISLAGGPRLSFEESGERLRIHLPRPAGRGDLLTIVISYEGNPRKGLFFIAPDRAYPQNPFQIWSQGEMEDSHFWFPVYDFPNDRATSEGSYTVNADFTVVSNGRLVGVEEHPELHTKTYHWKQEVPHSTYLISVVAGKFEKYTDAVGPVPLEYYVPPGTGRDKALRSFGETPDALRFFVQRIGLPYPFPKYSQVAVRDFTFGGMENISATTVTDRTLHEAFSEPQSSSTDLVTHELSHQWFGDLLTCADWSHVWLNEGFATFWAAVYREHRLGPEEYRYILHQYRSRYLREDQERYRRPLVTSFYTDPDDLFDRTLYEKGALVLDMLRYVLGDNRFFGALQSYARRFQELLVTTEDFRSAVEQATGEDLGWFFEQWLYQAGYPELEVSQMWDESAKRLRLVVEQKQLLDSVTPLFRMPVDVEFTTRAGKQTQRIEFFRARQEFDFRLDSQPLMTRFDPDHRILKTLRFSKPLAELVYQAVNDPSVPGRIWAIEQLGQSGVSEEAVRALRSRLTEDAFWGVRQAAAAALGQIKTETARRALAEGLRDKDARVRQAAVRALGSFPADKEAARIAAALFERDPNTVTAAEAAHAVGRIRAEGARKFLEQAVKRNSDQDIIRRYALAGLGELGDKKAWDVAAHWTMYGVPSQTRVVAIEALGKLGRGEDKTADKLIALLDDPDIFVRQRAMFSLGEGNFQKARAALQQSLQREVHSRTRRAAQTALQRLSAAKPPAPPPMPGAAVPLAVPAGSPVPLPQPAIPAALLP